ncbi:Gnk2-homologous domain [Sesbania bispinosa]|nr:Gnk2-homologous domain [Sesbania bispinosa]
MQTLYFVVLCVISFFPNGFSLADTNLQTGSQCAEADYSVNEDTFQTNLRSLLDSLAFNVVNHHGFYQTVVGKKGNKVYGTVLCRGDISAEDCSNCALNSTRVASDDCPKSRDVSIWFRWCFLRYSNESFFGVMQATAVAITNDTDFDDPSVVSEGLPFMSELAATAPEQSFMFQTAVLNTSQSGKRYGMAQCTRDINRMDCRRCLDAQLISFRTVIGNKRRWEIYGSNCFMWYNDYKFYSNVSALLSAAWSPSYCRTLIIGITVAVSAVLLAVF